MEETMKEKSEIISMVQERTPKICGVYFLFMGSKIIYIGQSRNVMQRIASHHKIGYTHYSIHECHDAYLDSLEAAYILEYQPEYNESIPNNENWKTANQIREFTNSDSILDTRRTLEKNKIKFKVFRGLVYYDFFEAYEYMVGKK